MPALRMEPVMVEAPASTANLGPGFDSLALALELHLRVTVTPLEYGAEQIVVEGEGADEIGLDAGNRFLIGLEHGLQVFGLEPPVMRIEMDNEIPLARGLGSSAAAAVAGLLAAEAMAGAEIGREEVHRIAAEIDGHPDNVGAALYGGLVVVARTAMVVAALTAARPELLAAMSEDRLHEPYRAKHFPQLPDLVAAARAAGALGAALSGAGSAVFAMCSTADDAERVAAAMAETAQRLDLPGRGLVVRPAMHGARVVS